jgi:hypothetical protein
MCDAMAAFTRDLGDAMAEAASSHFGNPNTGLVMSNHE